MNRDPNGEWDLFFLCRDNRLVECLQQQSLGRIEFGSASPAIHREDTSVTKALGTYSHTGSKLKSDALGSVRRTELAAIKQEITEHRAHSAMLA